MNNNQSFISPRINNYSTQYPLDRRFIQSPIQKQIVRQPISVSQDALEQLSSKYNSLSETLDITRLSFADEKQHLHESLIEQSILTDIKVKEIDEICNEQVKNVYSKELGERKKIQKKYDEQVNLNNKLVTELSQKIEIKTKEKDSYKEKCEVLYQQNQELIEVQESLLLKKEADTKLKFEKEKKELIEDNKKLQEQINKMKNQYEKNLDETKTKHKQEILKIQKEQQHINETINIELISSQNQKYRLFEENNTLKQQLNSPQYQPNIDYSNSVLLKQKNELIKQNSIQAEENLIELDQKVYLYVNLNHISLN